MLKHRAEMHICAPVDNIVYYLHIKVNGFGETRRENLPERASFCAPSIFCTYLLILPSAKGAFSCFLFPHKNRLAQRQACRYLGFFGLILTFKKIAMIDVLLRSVFVLFLFQQAFYISFSFPKLVKLIILFDILIQVIDFI